MTDTSSDPTGPWPPEVELTGAHVVITPLLQSHGPALAEAVKDGELWKLWYTTVPPPETMAANIADRLARRARGAWLPFAVISTATGLPVGMTSWPDRRRRQLIRSPPARVAQRDC